jgi:hypothetical protein
MPSSQRADFIPTACCAATDITCSWPVNYKFTAQDALLCGPSCSFTEQFAAFVHASLLAVLLQTSRAAGQSTASSQSSRRCCVAFHFLTQQAEIILILLLAALLHT